MCMCDDITQVNKASFFSHCMSLYACICMCVCMYVYMCVYVYVYVCVHVSLSPVKPAYLPFVRTYPVLSSASPQKLPCEEKI